jgi:hypothetical protein
MRIASQRQHRSDALSKFKVRAMLAKATIEIIWPMIRQVVKKYKVGSSKEDLAGK